TILPKTDTPGAKEAKVGAFMTVIVRDCYKPEEAKVFIAGLKKLEEESKKKNNKGFIESSAEERKALLTALDAEQKAFQEKKK
ncbi:gluconate 2-dehydrogenase subunit 3 family protein, partial [Klebsiella pneumoniae]|uniref:gluconate 2-dehydrogenase subunit 3 family protein n=1 Tax=Klebsiella pneumoniae TaxID=573 RepID=UPI003851D42B